MDYCLLEDAYKETSNTFDTTINCKDNYSIEKARKAERKKAKKRENLKLVDPSFNPEGIDPDRPAYNSKGKGVPVISLQTLSEAFTDISSNKVPVISSLTNTLPPHFRGNDDDNIEGFTNSFIKDDTTTDKGYNKAAGSDLPIPSINDNWKPMTDTGVTTSFFESMPSPGGTYPIWNKLNYSPKEVDLKKDVTVPVVNDNSNLQKKIDELLKRLEILEKERKSPSDNHNEILAFVGTGVFMIFVLNTLCR